MNYYQNTYPYASNNCCQCQGQSSGRGIFVFILVLFILLCLIGFNNNSCGGNQCNRCC